MKKYISILLTLCMMLTMLVLPMNVNASAFAGDTYYKFTFGEGGTAMGEYVTGQTATHKGVTYYPLIDQIPGSTTASVTTITDKATSSQVNTLRVEGSANSRWKMVPRKANGSPFEVAPNSKYTVKIKMFVEDKAASSQFFAGLAAYKSNGSSSHDGRNTTMGWFNGNFVASQAVHSPFLSGSIFSGAQAHYTDFDSTRSAQYIEKEFTLATGNNAVYDEANSTYKFVFDLIGSENTVENTNYFFLSGYGQDFTIDGTTYYDTVHIAEIEITKMGDTVTFINGNNSSSKEITTGETINYPALTANKKGDLVWSLSKDEYIPAPEKMPAGSITVYALQRDVIGFENYKYCDYTLISNRIGVSSEKFYNGNKSIKYENVEYKLSEEVTGGKPFSFNGSYYKYFYTYDEATGEYSLVPKGEGAPTWEPGKYYIKREAIEREHAIELWQLESNKNYKISFKYYFDESSQCGLTLKPFVSAADNIWVDETTFLNDYNVTINKPETAGWQDGEIYISTGVLSAQYLYLQLVNTANDNTTPVTVYFDEFMIEEKVKDQVDDPNVEYGKDLQSYCSFENTSATAKDAFLDVTNNYVVSRVDKGYVKEGKKILDEWFMSDRSGFDPTNFSMSNAGFESDHALQFNQKSESKGNSVAYKIADISDGVLLEDKTTYRLSFYYRATGSSDKDLTFSFVNAKDKNNVAAINESNTLTIAAADVKNGWTYVSVDLTTDFSKVNSDYNGEAFCIPAIVVNADINDTARTVYMDNFAVCKALGSSMVSVLTESAKNRSGGQAIRFFFNYYADENGNLLLSGGTHTLKARGILICDASKNEDLVVDNTKIIKNEKTDDFDHCWSYKNSELTFSTYITGFGFSDSRNIKVRGYVILEDGTVMYSPISNYCLDDVIGYHSLNAKNNYYSLDDSNVISKVGFEGANEKLANGYTFDWNGSALVVTAKAVGEMKVYLSGSVANRNFTLYIDGERISDKLKPAAENGKYVVTFDVGNYPTVKEIRFIRQQEADNGTAAILGFDMRGELLKTEEKDTLIEFLGDSITSGMGVHSMNHEDNSTARTDDGTSAYAFLTAQYLGVNYRIRSRIGIGVYKNSAGESGVKNGWVDSYNYENCWRDQTTTFSEERKADIVVIYLGTNEVFSHNVTGLREHMKTLINTVKGHNPNAKIVWICGGMKWDYKPEAEAALESFGGEAAGYYLCDMPSEFAHKDANGNYVNTGYHGHPGVEQQKVMAHTLIDFLKAKNLVD